MGGLVKCKECGAEISKKADACPKCGANRKPKQHGCGTLIVVVAVGFWVYSLVTPDSPTSTTTPAKVLTDAECKKDFSCWFERNQVKAHVACSKLIEAHAKYQHEWTDGFLELRFPRGGWIDKKKGVLFYSGDSIKFQNGFGAWQIHKYQCNYDPATKKVVNVIVQPRN